MREQTKHTPGPWKVMKAPEIFEGEYEYFQIIQGDFQIAKLHRGRTREIYEEQNDNACLIAAAPELLESCKAVLKNILNISESGEKLGLQNNGRLNASIAILGDAIAKAEGK